MSFYNDVDIMVSPSGDLSLAPNGDFELTSASGVLKQDIAFRLRTNFGEYEPNKTIGADLEELIGEPNVRSNTKIGETKVVHSLTYDGMIRRRDLYVRAVPLSTERTVYYVFVNDGVTQLNVTPDVLFFLHGGMINLPGTYSEPGSNRGPELGGWFYGSFEPGGWFADNGWFA